MSLMNGMIFFDLDKTLIGGQTGGVYNRNTMDVNQLIGNVNMFELFDYLQKLKDCGFMLFICSRGNVQNAKELLTDITNGEITMLSFFNGVLGANIGDNDYGIPNHQISDISLNQPTNSANWAGYKADMIDKVVTHHNFIDKKNKVHFLDDTQQNVNIVQQHEYNSYLVNNSIQEQNIISRVKNIYNDNCQATSTQQTNTQVQELEPRDVSQEYNNSVEKAISVFSEYVKIFNNSDGKWYHNPSRFNLINFVPYEQQETLQTDTQLQGLIPRTSTSARIASHDFDNSISNAIKYYKTNPYEYVKIYSNSHREWYHNPYSTEPTNFIKL
jgi:HAD superfamily phosphatase (TIGR01681 family)